MADLPDSSFYDDPTKPECTQLADLASQAQMQAADQLKQV